MTFRSLLGALAAVVAAGAWADAISLNFGVDKNGTSVSGSAQAGLVAGVTGDMWNNLSGTKGTDVAVRTSDHASVDGLTASWSCDNLYSYVTGVQETLIKDYLDDSNDHLSITVKGVPFAAYDVYIYCASDNENRKFGAMNVNGRYYRHDASAGDSARSLALKNPWGISRASTAVLGTNVMRVRGATGSTLTIRPEARDTAKFRCAVAAVQIVEVDYPLAGADFYWSGLPAEKPTGWGFSSWGGQAPSAYRRIDPQGREVAAVSENRAPYWAAAKPSAFTLSFIADFSDSDNSAKDACVLTIGSLGKSGIGCALLRKRGCDDVEFACVENTSTGGGKFSRRIASVTVPDVAPGYHLYTMTCSSMGISLKVDDRATASDPTACPTLHAGMQFGDVYGGRSDTTGAREMGVYEVHGWNRVLDEDEKDAVRTLLCGHALAQPMAFPSSYNLYDKNGIVTLPSLKEAGVKYVGGTCGTLQLLAGQTAQVSQLRFANIEGGETNLVTFNLHGTVNVTSTSTVVNAGSEITGYRGVILGNEVGEGRYYVHQGGVLDAPHAYIALNNKGSKSHNLYVQGGIVRARGVYATLPYNGISLSNGGVLELAEVLGSQVLNFHLGRGTLRAVPYVRGETVRNGWNLPSLAVLNFNDAADGTVVDLNGMAHVAAATINGSGRCILADASASGGGSIAFAQLSAFKGVMDVSEGVTVDIANCRPRGTLNFAAGTSLVLRESVADSDGYAMLNFTGAPAVTMYRADGVTPVPDARVVTEDGVQRIRYTPAETPVVSGEGCWLDFEFDNRSYLSTGVNKVRLSPDTTYGIGKNDTAANFRDDYSIYTASMGYTTIAYPPDWSAAIYATVPQHPHAAVMTFGTNGGGLIGLIAGDVDNEVLLVRTTKKEQYTVLARMTVPNAHTAQHLYVFMKNGREVKVYLDGALWQTYVSETDINIGNGFQLGSVHGGHDGTGILRFGSPNITGDFDNPVLTASYIGMLRVYDCELGSTARAALAAEFPYVSPNGLYTRALPGGELNWSDAAAWTLQAENPADRTQADAPAAFATVRLQGAAETASTVAVNVAEDAHFESMAFNGPGAIALVAGDGAGRLVNDGKTVVNTDVTITHGAADVSGGPLALAAGATLTFDWRAYDVPFALPNQSVRLTGLSDAFAAVSFLAPTETKGRTFTLRFASEDGCWYVDVARPKLAVEWKGVDATWSADTVWRDAATGADVAFLAGDDAAFPTCAAAQAIEVEGEKSAGALTFSADSDYALTGAALHPTGLAKTGTGALTVANAVVSESRADIALAAGATDLADLRGTFGRIAFADGAGEELARLGTGGFLSLGGGLAFGAGRDAEVAAAQGAELRLFGALAAPAGTTLRKTGAGTVVVSADAPEFLGRLVVEAGIFSVTNGNLMNMTATAADPVRVLADGMLRVRADAGGFKYRLPKGAVVDVDGGVAHISGNNPFYRTLADGPTFKVHGGGRVQFDGANVSHDIRVEAVELDGATMHLAGTVANWGGYVAQITGGAIRSRGASAITQQGGQPGYIGVPKPDSGDARKDQAPDTNFLVLDVADGTLTMGARSATGLAKTGAGALELTGVGGASNRVVEVRGGTLVGNAALAANVRDLSFADGTRLDLSALDAALAGPAVTVPQGAKVAVELAGRDVHIGDRLVSWTAETKPAGRFVLEHARVGAALKKDDGLYVGAGGLTFVVR